MGLGVSNWRLAKSVSIQGQMGVVSGAALDSILVRRLQLGDKGGHIRRALSHFPWQDMANRLLDKYFIEGGKAPDAPFKLVPMPIVEIRPEAAELVILGNFVEVFLAKEGHDGLVGINYLAKIQLPTLPAIFGSMLANVDYVIMGAGIPLTVPGTLDSLARWEPARHKLEIHEGARPGGLYSEFDPNDYCSGNRPELNRPKFLPIISSDILAKTMIRKATGSVEGFIVEHYSAGGHNAPPRKKVQPPAYGDKDIPNLAKIRDHGLPFWLAGGYASPAKLQEAKDHGATGIQVGTAFALCDESGIMPGIKREVLHLRTSGELEIFTDFNASPTGYPFKLIHLKGSLGPHNDTRKRRVCDIGYLRQLYFQDSESRVRYRCPGEPVDTFINKGGESEEVLGRQCLCNGLLATVGLGQVSEEGCEVPLITAGEDFSFVEHILKPGSDSYSAKEVIDYLLS